MSRGKAAHKREKKRRHERQIAEGTRVKREKVQKKIYVQPRERKAVPVRLSTIDREVVRGVIEKVKEIEVWKREH